MADPTVETLSPFLAAVCERVLSKYLFHRDIKREELSVAKNKVQFGNKGCISTISPPPQKRLE